MSFSVVFQKNNSEKISLTKSLTNVVTMDVVLKEETSIIDPVLIINAELSTFAEVNYCTISAFKRSYFILNIASITNDLVELTCHVDVLSSFESEIKANKGIVHRQENDWNLYLNDGVLQFYQNPIITTLEFPNGFTENNFVAVLAGSRGGGIGIGPGGIVQVTPRVVQTDGGGDRGTEYATTAGMVQYAYAQVGKPYWWGTFGNLATQDLLDYKRKVAPAYYADPGEPPFVSQLGERVHDCVGLVKAYRWRGPFSNVDPRYEASQDVDVKGLWNQCIIRRGELNDASNPPYIGAVVFYDDFTHCGVLVERNVVVEAKGHRDGVVQSQLSARPHFTYWGVPDWMRINTPRVDDSTITITQQPVDATVAAGSRVEFIVVATGDGLTYQWQYSNDNGSTWSDSTVATAQTSMLVLYPRSLLNGYMYRCIITNSWGSSVISNAALLTVT